MKDSPTSIAVTVNDHPAMMAARWLIGSGIQYMGSDDQKKGGVNAWYDLNGKSYPFLYPEITGYAINAFLYFYHITRDPHYLQGARCASDWLLKVQDPKTGLIDTRYPHEAGGESYYESWIFSFDHWVIIHGLCNLYRVTHEPLYLEKAEIAARFLLDRTVREDGTFYAMLNTRTYRPQSLNDKWSRQSGSFHAKAIFGLYQLYEHTRVERYLASALRLAGVISCAQEFDGRFITQDCDGSTDLHPHLYTLEGLLYLGLVEEETELVRIVEKGLHWVLNAQAPDGSIYSIFRDGRFIPVERSDVLAQTLRLSAIMMQCTPSFSAERPKLDLLRAKLLLYQITSGDQIGGFLYGQEEDGTSRRHVNAWSTMFAAQGLWIYDHLVSGGKAYDFRFFS